MKTSKKSVIKMVMLTSASFAGYNIGSGFATGIEVLQFFASWGSGKAYINNYEIGRASCRERV